MGFMDELKKLARPYAEEDDDFEEDFDLDEESTAKPSRLSRGSSRSRSAAQPASPSAFDEVLEGLSGSRSSQTESKVVNLHTASQMQVVLVKPDRFDNVSEIAEHLRSKHAVVLNLEATNKDVARRLVDFLSGCAYALDGKIKKVAISTYIITPYNMDIVGDLIDDLESGSMYL